MCVHTCVAISSWSGIGNGWWCTGPPCPATHNNSEHVGGPFSVDSVMLFDVENDPTESMELSAKVTEGGRRWEGACVSIGCVCVAHTREAMHARTCRAQAHKHVSYSSYNFAGCVLCGCFCGCLSPVCVTVDHACSIQRLWPASQSSSGSTMPVQYTVAACVLHQIPRRLLKLTPLRVPCPLFCMQGHAEHLILPDAKQAPQLHNKTCTPWYKAQ